MRVFVCVSQRRQQLWMKDREETTSDDDDEGVSFKSIIQCLMFVFILE